MDIARPSNARQKRIRQAIYAGVGLLAVVLVTLGLSRLKPAAPTVERASVWPDTVKRGPMVRQVRGLGTLVAGRHPVDSGDDAGAGREDHPAARHAGEGRQRDSRAHQPAARTGAAGRELKVQAAEAGLANLQRAAARTTCSQQRASAASIEADYNKAKMQAQMNEALAKDQLVSDAGARSSRRWTPSQLGDPQRDREGAAREQRRIDARAARGAAVATSIRRAPCCS